MKKALLLFILLPLPLFLFPTCIVIFRTEKAIIVAADSKRQFYSRFGDQVDNAYCKIHKTGKYFCAIAGFVDSGQLLLATKAAAQSKTFGAMIEKFRMLVEDSLAKSIERFKVTRGEQAYRNRFGSQTAAETTIFGFERGKAHLVTFVFRAAERIDGKIVINTKKITDNPIAYLGFHEILDTLSAATMRSLLKRSDSVTVIKSLIKMEIQAHPGYIGEPIDVLKLTAKGEEWIAKKTNCN